MQHELQVWLFEQHIGTLTLSDARLGFRYATAWLSRPDATALSASLPLQAQAFDDRQTRPFFAGLLPEGQLRQLLAQRLQISGQNDFALLQHIGGECAGAVSFLEPGQALPATTLAHEAQWLHEDELLALLDELPRRPMLAGKDGLRLSLAGAQDKLPVVFDGARIGLPLGGAPSTHILKPAIHAIEASVLNEGFCMALAEAMQLQPARASIQRAQGRAFLLVERYDRRPDAQGRWQRLHQEDFCQALGVAPETKYQNEGGPDLPLCFALLRRATRPSAPQVLRLLDGVIFNALIGNHDAHAKNFSLLYAGDSPVLAPFYDLLSTAVYAELTPKMAMKIGSKYQFDQVYARHWEQFAQSAGLTKAQARRRILQWGRSLPGAARKLQASNAHGFARHAMVERICALIEQRCAQTVRRLTELDIGPSA
ncbi:type II toxin-antitoxin system HipA family toxin [Vandammella animalimorsus]|uniref:Type II toxin-antitoxin system HipA family toxin n=1 Tax=Vandammella animalimorsus TaxID=2029117 RepID=A0A3M6RIB5_9BURK|nr:type II toxin-antitoxin system HipA family toxin [Vandammella animalimorsus]RMX14931.1 type II toxin-antitoxin system HipA family toxin [Vandammella animalimorsus]